MRKNCSSDREFAKSLRSLEQFIQTVKGQNNCNFKLEQLEFILEKITRIQKHAGKARKLCYLTIMCLVVDC